MKGLLLIVTLACVGCVHPWVQTHPLRPHEVYRCESDAELLNPRDISPDGRHRVREPDGTFTLCGYVHRVPKGMPTY